MVTLADGSVSPDLLLTAREAAHMLRVSERKFWSLTASGDIPCVRIGRSVRYVVDDLRSWVESRKEHRS